MMEITLTCRSCGTANNVFYQNENGPTTCANCASQLLPFVTQNFLKETKIDQCPACGSSHLYRQRDFNRLIGIGLVVVGVALAYWTYGMSLLAVAVLDWMLYRLVGEVGCCYRCHAQIRGTSLVDELESFNLVLHDHYRTVSAEESPTGQNA